MVVNVVITQGEDGFFVASFPSLKSCWSQGKSKEEAIDNIEEAISLYWEPLPTQMIPGDTCEIVELTL